MTQPPPLIDSHTDVAGGYRFPGIVYRGQAWNLAHLNPFAFQAQLSEGLSVDVVVMFSCHCFTHSRKRDARDVIPADEHFWETEHVLRILNPERYELSRQFLPTLVRELGSRHIKVVGGDRPNYLCFELLDQNGKPVYYSVFFEVIKDTTRKKRILLRVQTAYVLEELTHRLVKARKINLAVLLKAVYEGRAIKA